MPESHFILVLAALTGAGAYVLGRRLGLARAALRPAASRMLECMGLAAAFFAANVLAGVVLTLVLRALLDRFISMYVVADYALVGLSLLQAITFQWWASSRK